MMVPFCMVVEKEIFIVIVRHAPEDAGSILYTGSCYFVKCNTSYIR